MYANTMWFKSYEQFHLMNVEGWTHTVSLVHTQGSCNHACLNLYTYYRVYESHHAVKASARPYDPEEVSRCPLKIWRAGADPGSLEKEFICLKV